MIVCLDVDYRGDDAQVAAIVFEKWASDTVTESKVLTVKNVHPYVPGEFYKRELPCLLAVLAELKSPIDLIVVDSYVWLAKDKPGMGHHLYEALDKKIPVIGVAKTHFKTDDCSVKILRGESKTPLFLTCIGIEQIEAATFVSVMHGDHRIPTLLKLVDKICRG